VAATYPHWPRCGCATCLAHPDPAPAAEACGAGLTDGVVLWHCTLPVGHDGDCAHVTDPAPLAKECPRCGQHPLSPPAPAAGVCGECGHPTHAPGECPKSSDYWAREDCDCAGSPPERRRVEVGAIVEVLNHGAPFANARISRTDDDGFFACADLFNGASYWFRLADEGRTWRHVMGGER